jgi:hypothetical protein
MRLGYHIGSDEFVPAEDRMNIIKQCPVIIVCLDTHFQNSKRCTQDLKKLKLLYPTKKILTLVIEEKFAGWAMETSKELCNLSNINTNINNNKYMNTNSTTTTTTTNNNNNHHNIVRLPTTTTTQNNNTYNNNSTSTSTSTMVDIGYLGRGAWHNNDDGPNTAMLTALYKNLEIMKYTILQAGCQPFSKENLNRFQGRFIR